MADLPRLILSPEQSYTLGGLSFQYLWLHKFVGVAPMKSTARAMRLEVVLCPYAAVGDVLVFDEPRLTTVEIPDLPVYLAATLTVANAFLNQPFLSAICAAIQDQIPAWDSVAVEVTE